MKNPHRQVVLRAGDIELIANVPDHPKLKLGSTLTLKEFGDKWWVVRWMSEHVTDKSELRTDWNNNI